MKLVRCMILLAQLLSVCAYVEASGSDYYCENNDCSEARRACDFAQHRTCYQALRRYMHGGEDFGDASFSSERNRVTLTRAGKRIAECSTFSTSYGDVRIIMRPGGTGDDTGKICFNVDLCRGIYDDTTGRCVTGARYPLYGDKCCDNYLTAILFARDHDHCIGGRENYKSGWRNMGNRCMDTNNFLDGSADLSQSLPYIITSATGEKIKYQPIGLSLNLGEPDLDWVGDDYVVYGDTSSAVLLSSFIVQKGNPLPHAPDRTTDSSVICSYTTSLDMYNARALFDAGRAWVSRDLNFIEDSSDYEFDELNAAWFRNRLVGCIQMPAQPLVVTPFLGLEKSDGIRVLSTFELKKYKNERNEYFHPNAVVLRKHSGESAEVLVPLSEDKFYLDAAGALKSHDSDIVEVAFSKKTFYYKGKVKDDYEYCIYESEDDAFTDTSKLIKCVSREPFGESDYRLLTEVKSSVTMDEEEKNGLYICSYLAEYDSIHDSFLYIVEGEKMAYRMKDDNGETFFDVSTGSIVARVDYNESSSEDVDIRVKTLPKIPRLECAKERYIVSVDGVKRYMDGELESFDGSRFGVVIPSLSDDGEILTTSLIESSNREFVDRCKVHEVVDDSIFGSFPESTVPQILRPRRMIPHEYRKTDNTILCGSLENIDYSCPARPCEEVGGAGNGECFITRDRNNFSNIVESCDSHVDLCYCASDYCPDGFDAWNYNRYLRIKYFPEEVDAGANDEEDDEARKERLRIEYNTPATPAVSGAEKLLCPGVFDVRKALENRVIQGDSGKDPRRQKYMMCLYEKGVNQQVFSAASLLCAEISDKILRELIDNGEDGEEPEYEE